jgi:hypothetical protein
MYLRLSRKRQRGRRRRGLERGIVIASEVWNVRTKDLR